VTDDDDGGAPTDGDGGPPGDDGGPDAQPLPEGAGWIQLPGTTIQAACPYNEDPVISGVEGCSAIVNDWNGGIADTARDRLIVWGGGHNGYYGNEVYALDLGSQELVRLNDASPPHPIEDQCAEELPDGTPSSRHTYDGLAYIAHADRMFVYGGSPACTTGGVANDTWTLDLGSLTWERMDPANGGNPGQRPGAVADYDPETELVFLHDVYDLWTYDYDTNTYDKIASDQFIDYHLTGRIDPERRLFLLIGNGFVHAFDLSDSSPAREDWTVTGCDEVVDAIYPGLAYEPSMKKFVAWGGGDTVYALDPDARSCTPLTDGGGPGPQVGNGTHGRWRYFPALGVFALVNQWDQDAFLFRLEP
jgi:hypothetical protein